MIEVWKDIEGYECLYSVSNTGKVKSHDRIYKGELSNHTGLRFYSEKPYKGRLLRLESPGRKYHTICLNKNGNRNFQHVHRLVAKAFIPNLEGKEQVNHIDGNMKNNDVSNLEWVTRKENGTHAAKTGLYRTGEKHQNSRIVLNTQTGIYYFSVREAAETTNIKRATLTCMLLGINRNRTSFIYV